MASTNFVDFDNSTPIVAAWLNDVNRTQYTILGNPADRAGYIALDTAHAGGTSDAITGTFGVALTTVPDGTVFYVRATAANTTTTPTFTPNIGVVTPATIVKGLNTPLLIGDIYGAGHWIALRWDSTYGVYILLNPFYGSLNSLLNSRNPQGAAYAIVVSDRGKLVDATTGTWALTMNPTTLGANFAFAVRNSGTGIITLTPSTGTVDGAVTVALNAGESCLVFCDGTNFKTIGRYAFTASLAGNGYQKLPSGLIIQWGSVSAANPSSLVTFPIAFPNAIFQGYATSLDTTGATYRINATSLTTGSMLVINTYSSVLPAAWLAIGY